MFATGKMRTKRNIIESAPLKARSSTSNRAGRLTLFCDETYLFAVNGNFMQRQIHIFFRRAAFCKVFRLPVKNAFVFYGVAVKVFIVQRMFYA